MTCYNILWKMAMLDIKPSHVMYFQCWFCITFILMPCWLHYIPLFHQIVQYPFPSVTRSAPSWCFSSQQISRATNSTKWQLLQNWIHTKSQPIVVTTALNTNMVWPYINTDAAIFKNTNNDNKLGCRGIVVAQIDSRDNKNQFTHNWFLIPVASYSC